MRVFLDTNVLVAACIEDHEHYSRAVPLLDSVHQGRHQGFTSGHAVLEVYSVLTRLPRSPRIIAPQAAALLQENILKHFTLIALTGKEYADLVLSIGIEGAIGGQVYDALHLACAQKCKSERIYSFNARHFQSLAPEHLQTRIMAP